MTDINKTLEERQKTHGEFADHDWISQDLCESMRQHPNFNDLSAMKKESLEMIQHKVARIINGDSGTHDHWHDIAGYATLVANRLTDNNERK